MKKIVTLCSVMMLLMVGLLTYRYLSPVYRAKKELQQADYITFDIRYHIEKNEDEVENDTSAEGGLADSIMPLMSDGTAHLEYAGGITHGKLYVDGYDEALIDAYRDSDGEIIIDVRQFVLFGADYVSDKISIPIDALFHYMDSGKCFVTEAQFEEITGVKIIPTQWGKHMDQDAFGLLANKSKYKLRDAGYSAELDITYTIPEEKEAVDIQVPESTVDDTYIWVYQLIFDKIIEHLS